jgi:hypothetical protein
MKPISSALMPNATNLIRLDHTHALATFHQYKISSKPQVKRGTGQHRVPGAGSACAT